MSFDEFDVPTAAELEEHDSVCGLGEYVDEIISDEEKRAALDTVEQAFRDVFGDVEVIEDSDQPF
jgi:transketolase C-terminal domain/subunit